MTEDTTDDRREPGSQWYDQEAGPLVRPYAMTGGRTKPGPTGVRFDLIALVTLDIGAPGLDDDTGLGPEHRALIDLCRPETQSVAELAAGADLPWESSGCSWATSWSSAASPSAVRCRPRSCPTNGFCAR